MNALLSKIQRNILFLIASFICLNTVAFGQSLPRPDHIVIVIFENKDYSQIVGSPSAPYINSLLADPNTAKFTRSYALTHPSQPNYLMLFSGSNQGVTTDHAPAGTPFTTCNLGALLIQHGFSFAGYCEDMPYAGYLGPNTNLYYTKHNPWSNWQGTLANNVPPAANQPFSAFPSNYDHLPDLCFVIPNINNCMHNGSISLGDSWLRSNLDNYIQWARSNNSLFILTFDEDNETEGNRILTFFYGPMVNGGSYNTYINHYSLLRTLEDMYGPRCGSSASVSPIDQVWKPINVIEEQDVGASISVFPNPASNQVSLRIKTRDDFGRASIAITDICGKTLLKTDYELKEGDNLVNMNCAFSKGMYWVSLTTPRGVTMTRKLVVE